MNQDNAEQELERQKKADGRVLGAAFLIPFLTIFAVGWLFPPYNPMYLALSVAMMSGAAANTFQHRGSLLEPFRT